MTRKKWVKPKLIILTKGKPEERVLGVCKSISGPTGMQATANACSQEIGCTLCVDMSVS